MHGRRSTVATLLFTAKGQHCLTSSRHWPFARPCPDHQVTANCSAGPHTELALGSLRCPQHGPSPMALGLQQEGSGTVTASSMWEGGVPGSQPPPHHLLPSPSPMGWGLPSLSLSPAQLWSLPLPPLLSPVLSPARFFLPRGRGGLTWSPASTSCQTVDACLVFKIKVCGGEGKRKCKELRCFLYAHRPPPCL